jgi:signal transduction histidine kinase
MSPLYGNIRPGNVATSSGHYRLFIDPQCPSGTEVSFKVSIAASGIQLWRDSFSVRVLPPWWRTTWAYAIYLTLAIGSLGGAIWFAGNRKLKQRIKLLEQEWELERERARISQDMHDEVGATLTEIIILSELAKKKPEEAGGHIQQISERAAEVIDNISEIVWASIVCHFAVPDSLPAHPLSAEVRRNLFLATKEAIHNIVKHSQASEVAIGVTLEKSRVELSIEDNGRGFSVDDRWDIGNGLDNMKKRMEEIGGSLRIESKQDKGTKVVIGLNL